MRKSRYPVLSRGSLMKQLTALFSFPANSRRTPGFNIIRPRFHVSGHTNLRPVCNTEWRRCRPSRPQVIPSACSSPRVASRNIYLARRFGIMQNAVEIRSSRPKLAHERASNDTQRPITHCARLCSRPWPLRLSPPLSRAWSLRLADTYNTGYASALLRTRLRANAFPGVRVRAPTTSWRRQQYNFTCRNPRSL